MQKPESKKMLTSYLHLRASNYVQGKRVRRGCISLKERMVALSYSEAFCGFSTFELAAGSTSVFLLMVIPNVSVIPLHLKRPSPPACSKITELVLKVSVASQECQYFTRLRRLERYLQWASWKPAAKPARNSSCGKT